MEFFGHVIDGKEVPSIDGATMETIDPYTQKAWATVALGGKADADRAIAAACKAFDTGPGHGRHDGHGQADHAGPA